MLYKPKYCSNCGTKIERVEWFPWTSRRFCEVCETEHKFYEWLMPAFAAVALLFGVFGFGNYLLSGEKQVSVAENQTTFKTLKPKTPSKDDQNAVNRAENSQTAGNNAGNANAPDNLTAQAKPPQVVQQTNPPQTENVPVVKAKDPVYFCGAQTKKGAPCSRRVKGGGRCWQHEGLAAMLPPEKLLANR